MIVAMIQAQAKLIKTSLGTGLGGDQAKADPQTKNTSRLVATTSANTARQKKGLLSSSRLVSMIGEIVKQERNCVEGGSDRLLLIEKIIKFLVVELILLLDLFILGPMCFYKIILCVL